MFTSSPFLQTAWNALQDVATSSYSNEMECQEHACVEDRRGDERLLYAQARNCAAAMVSQQYGFHILRTPHAETDHPVYTLLMGSEQRIARCLEEFGVALPDPSAQPHLI